MAKTNTSRNGNHTNRIDFVGTIAQRNPDELKITVGARGSSHQVTFEVFDVEIDKLVNFAGERLRIILERIDANDRTNLQEISVTSESP